MGILSCFWKQTYTLYIGNHSGLFVDHYDPDLRFRLDYKYMDMHENRYNGMGVDYDNLPRLLDPPIRTVIKTSSDLFALSKIADEFNEAQANDLYYRVSKKIPKGNISHYNSDRPFPIKFLFDYNALDYPSDNVWNKWDEWYWDEY